jgi:hypothetical protein
VGRQNLPHSDQCSLQFDKIPHFVGRTLVSPVAMVRQPAGFHLSGSFKLGQKATDAFVHGVSPLTVMGSLAADEMHRRTQEKRANCEAVSRPWLLDEDWCEGARTSRGYPPSRR